MKKTRDAVRYGIETLKVTPEEMFALIESSNGYDGSEYNRWLANEIIKIAEEDGVGFSQLLVKKFSIIHSLAEDSEAVMKPEWVEKLKSMVGLDLIYSNDFSYLGEPISEDIDWFNGLDYDEANCFFTESLPEAIKAKIMGKEDLAILSRLSSEASSKSCDMFKSAKSYGITCKNEGSLMLFRMCSLAEAHDLGKNFKFAFFTDVDFLSDSDNAAIIKYFLTHFKYEGITVKSTELFSDTFVSSQFAFVVCTPRTVEDGAVQDGFCLREATLDDSVISPVLRYSRSERLMRDQLIALDKKVTTGRVLGYLNFSRSFACSLSTVADNSAAMNIRITNGNLKHVIVYYGVVKSLQAFGMPADIHKVMNGSPDYTKLLYNCLPLFLFDVDSKFGDVNEVKSSFNVESEMVKKLLETGEIYFLFEAKELIDICKGFLDYLSEKEDVTSLTFEEVRKEANHEDLNTAYISALRNLKDAVKTLYLKMEG